MSFPLFTSSASSPSALISASHLLLTLDSARIDMILRHLMTSFPLSLLICKCRVLASHRLSHSSFSSRILCSCFLSNLPGWPRFFSSSSSPLSSSTLSNGSLIHLPRPPFCHNNGKNTTACNLRLHNLPRNSQQRLTNVKLTRMHSNKPPRS
ncbi:uncharacterized protein EDB91DRAFT_892894 [Suillus paluster]|uniref:uncharacterized protein n=1 Tax=Suillus paluster TaxID=48578 RepID=UPI001B88403A|nr:uncharacterized protein EDB91DRAFT_892894 [Suillus paluster]KAG1727257.1 hypothetical protein EDB91DRAFT_892894 [Suillus paluster]